MASVLALVLAFGGLPAIAQNPTPKEAEYYFNIFETIRSVTGSSTPPQNMVLIRTPDILVWMNRAGELLLLSLDSTNPLCRFGEVAPNVRSALSSALGALSGLTSLTDASAFPGGMIVSVEFTSLLRGIGAHIPTGSCVVDIHNVGLGSGLLGAITQELSAGSEGAMTLYWTGRTISVRRGDRTWLGDATNSARLVKAIDAQPLDEILAFGKIGLVAVAPNRIPFLMLWKDGRTLNLLPWADAEKIVTDQGTTLFSDNATASMADEDAYFDLLALIANEPSAWRRFVRQAPHLVFRNWKAP